MSPAQTDRIVVTVDGLAGSGKSTISRLLAEKLGYVHLNSGLLYRASAWVVGQANQDVRDGAGVARLVGARNLALIADHRGPRVTIDGADVTDHLFTPEVSELTSQVSQHPALRAVLEPNQRDAFAGKPIVAEGRDMGTVIFPLAQVKFFITADEKVRVARRIWQLYGETQGLDQEQLKSLNQKIQIEIHERDARDQMRAASPTVAASDAILVDNSEQTLTSLVQSMYDTVLARVTN